MPAELTADLSKPLMPKATAMWLIDNTILTFDQIGDFCGLHEIEVQALADADVGRGMTARNPIDFHELSADDIKRCEADATARLHMIRPDIPLPKIRAKGPRYTPVVKRSDKPDALAWLIKHHPELSDAAMCKLVGSTKTTLQSVRDRSHPNSANLKPRSPAEIGLCTYGELDRVVHKALRALGRDPVAEAKAKQERLEAEAQENAVAQEPTSKSFDFSNFFKTSNSSSGA
jgi:uncharacterized protein